MQNKKYNILFFCKIIIHSAIKKREMVIILKLWSILLNKAHYKKILPNNIFLLIIILAFNFIIKDYMKISY